MIAENMQQSFVNRFGEISPDAFCREALEVAMLKGHWRKFGVGVLIAFTVKGLATTGLIVFAAGKSLGFF